MRKKYFGGSNAGYSVHDVRKEGAIPLYEPVPLSNLGAFRKKSLWQKIKRLFK